MQRSFVRPLKCRADRDNAQSFFTVVLLGYQLLACLKFHNIHRTWSVEVVHIWLFIWWALAFGFHVRLVKEFRTMLDLFDVTKYYWYSPPKPFLQRRKGGKAGPIYVVATHYIVEWCFMESDKDGAECVAMLDGTYAGLALSIVMT